MKFTRFKQIAAICAVAILLLLSYSSPAVAILSSTSSQDTTGETDPLGPDDGYPEFAVFDVHGENPCYSEEDVLYIDPPEGSKVGEYPTYHPDGGLTNDFTFTGMNFIGQVVITRYQNLPPLPLTMEIGGCGGGGGQIGSGLSGGGPANSINPLTIKKSDCDGITTANKILANAQVKNVIKNIKNKNVEWAASISVANPKNANVIEVGEPYTNNIPNRVSFSPQWRANEAYNIGFIHNHPAGTAPSPSDIFNVAHSFTQMAIQDGIGHEQLTNYINNYSSIVVSGDYVYTITVKDARLFSYMKDAFTPQRQAIENERYLEYVKKYYDDNDIDGEATAEEKQSATEFALLKLFDEMINLNKQKISDQNNNKSIKRDGKKKVKSNGC